MSGEIRESFEKWAAANNHHTEEYMFEAWEAGRESERQLQESRLKAIKTMMFQLWYSLAGDDATRGDFMEILEKRWLALIPSEKDTQK